MLRRPPRSTLFPTRRSSDLRVYLRDRVGGALACDYFREVVAAEAELSQLLRSSRDKDRKSTRLNSSHRCISYAVFCLKKKKKTTREPTVNINDSRVSTT